MEVDPIPEDVRRYLQEHFASVRDEPPEGNYYVFSMRLGSGERRELRVHRELFIFADLVPSYLQESDITAQLMKGNVVIAKPLRT